MNEQDYQLLSQYLDGELNARACQQLEQRLASETALRDTLAQMRRQDDSLKRAFENTGTVPAHVRALLDKGSNVVALPRRSENRIWHYAVAASLVAAAGVVLTTARLGQPSAEALLAQALETTPAMAEGWQVLDNGQQLRPVLSFRHHNGAWCREFLLLTGDDSNRGVACREAGEWRTTVSSPASIPGDSTEFRPASAADADPVASYLASHADSIPLSASEEAALIERGWE